MTNSNPSQAGTIYEAIGGQPVVDHLVNSLYNHVAKHEALIPIFPEDLTETRYKQRLFLTQFFGGPNLYIQEIGHPMLKRRHLPFEITWERRNAWLECMDKALDEAEVTEPYRSEIFERLSITGTQMINTEESEST